MRPSVRWILLLSSLAVALVAIVAVGSVTLLLIEHNLALQEEQYLANRGQKIVRSLEGSFQMGFDHVELQKLAIFGLLTERVRVRVVSMDGELLADSGTFDELHSTRPLNGRVDQSATWQLYFDDRGHIQGFTIPFENTPMMVGHQPMLGQIEGGLAGDVPSVSWPPISELSEVQVRLPIEVDEQVLAYAELSEGPAFGQVVRNSIQKALVIGGIAALAMATLAALIAAQRLTRPLVGLGQAADEMAAGNFAARAPSSRLTEYDHLARRFNDMAARLGEVISSLEADRLSLRRLIADASHELRTPLTALLTFNQLMEKEPALASEPAATFVAESGRQLARLDSLTTGLLDLSRLEAGLSGTDFALGNLNHMLQEVAGDFGPLIEARNQRLEMVLDPDSIEFSFDSPAMNQAVSNLIANATKYTQDGGWIRLSLQTDGEWAIIRVADNGPGIAQADLSRVFERFYRGKSDQAVEGSGLGLAITQEIIRLHGGTIAVRSQPGQGSEFIITLPLSDLPHSGTQPARGSEI